VTRVCTPALIVFCREPVPGRAKTRLARRIGPAAAAAMAHAFTLDALANARALQPQRLVIAGAAARGTAANSAYFRGLARRFDARLLDQGEGTLGRRMARVLAPFAADGGALLIGTDTPSLPRTLLARNLTALRGEPVVLGPSLDGGYYAIGMRGGLAPVFTGIRWGGARVLAATVARLRSARLSYGLGPAWYDVDTWPDLLLLAAHLRFIEARERGGAARRCPATAALLRRLGLLESPR
jgi:uncharacterized protein